MSKLDYDKNSLKLYFTQCNIKSFGITIIKEAPETV